jgi:hypothetical protein
MLLVTLKLYVKYFKFTKGSNIFISYTKKYYEIEGLCLSRPTVKYIL